MAPRENAMDGRREDNDAERANHAYKSGAGGGRPAESEATHAGRPWKGRRLAHGRANRRTMRHREPMDGRFAGPARRTQLLPRKGCRPLTAGSV